ncbi:MAG: SH3 domain-containing protein [Gemmatimonadota bacterium]
MVPELLQYQSSVDDPRGLARLEAGLTPQRAFVGQQVTLFATATFPPEAGYELTAGPEFIPPGASDAWTVDIPYSPPLPAAVQGRVEEAHTFLRAYFPLAPGLLSVDPPRLTYATQSGFPPPLDTLAGAPLVAQVDPVPVAEAPPDWDGAVGRYQISVSVTPTELGWGESALLVIELTGAGYVPDLPPPRIPPLFGGGVRPLTQNAWIEVRDGVIGGVKRFSWLVVPVEAGPMRIEPVAYTYFDPYLGSFVQVATAEMEVMVHEAGVPPVAQPPDPGGEGEPPHLATPPPPLPDSTVAQDPAFPHMPDAGRILSRVSPEAEVVRLESKLRAHPSDAGLWKDLGDLLEEARPGEGWGPWAWRSGLMRRPGDAELRRRVWSSTRWRGEPGLPILPIPAWYAWVLGGVASGGGLAFLFLRGWGRGRRWAGLALLASVAGLTPLPFLLKPGGAGVVIGRPVAGHVLPDLLSDSVTVLDVGTPVAFRERWGDWIRVRPGGGGEAWVPSSRLQPLGRVETQERGEPTRSPSVASIPKRSRNSAR